MIPSDAPNAGFCSVQRIAFREHRTGWQFERLPGWNPCSLPGIVVSIPVRWVNSLIRVAGQGSENCDPGAREIRRKQRPELEFCEN